jgi:hypothetical protein
VLMNELAPAAGKLDNGEITIAEIEILVAQ